MITLQINKGLLLEAQEYNKDLPSLKEMDPIHRGVNTAIGTLGGGVTALGALADHNGEHQSSSLAFGMKDGKPFSNFNTVTDDEFIEPEVAVPVIAGSALAGGALMYKGTPTIERGINNIMPVSWKQKDDYPR